MRIGAPTPAPTANVTPLCPFCRSQQVATTSKAVTDATYWRCHTCGQIWNPSRLAANGGSRWRG
jgi:transposase-like protein